MFESAQVPHERIKGKRSASENQRGGRKDYEMTTLFSAVYFFQEHGFSVHETALQLGLPFDIAEQLWFNVASEVNCPAQ
jgi:hypothetical protein